MLLMVARTPGWVGEMGDRTDCFIFYYGVGVTGMVWR